jgi:hypothetical protein
MTGLQSREKDAMATRIESQAEPIPGYRLLERLGGGGFGEVWKAEAPGGLHKAIKFVYGDLSNANDDVQRAEQELKALNRVKSVRHPYILSLERIEIIDGQLMIVMELADRSLWDRFRECRSQGMPGIPREELLRYMEETAEALDLMNGEYGLQHLDIKPQNLFLVHQHVKVADFGLVKDLEGMQASVTGGVTPVYAAPEIFDGKVSRFSDQYSLAIVFQELLTGQRPFNGTNIRQLILQHMQSPPDLSSLAPGDQAVVSRALRKVPTERYAKCHEMVAALRRTNGTVGAVSPSRQVEALRTTEGVAPGSFIADDAPTSPEMLTQMLRGRSDTRTARLPVFATPEVVEMPAVGEEPTTAPAEFHGDGCLFPAVVVGIGQVGMLVLRRLRAELHDQFGPPARLPNVRLLLVDTDPAVLQAAASRDRPETSLSGSEVLVTPLNRPSHYLRPREGKPNVESWLHARMVYRIPRSQAACGMRALGRLAYWDNYRSIARRVRQELLHALDDPALKQAAADTGLGVRSNRPRVYVVASLAGGTGSGMFLDLAYTARALLKQLGYSQPDVVGLLLMPPADGPAARSMQLGNAYAALTELTHYGTPGATFEARYEDQDDAIVDSEPPFSRTTLIGLPLEADVTASQAVLGRTARLLVHELCSPLGRAIDLTRAGISGPRWDLRGLCYQTVGMREIAWPRRHLLRIVARRLCQRLVDAWMSKNGEPVRHAAQVWIDEQLAARELTADHFISRLTEECAKTLGVAPEDAFQDILKPLTARLGTDDKPASGRSSWRIALRSPDAPDLPPEAFEVGLKCLSELFGRPGAEGSETMTQLVVALREGAERLTAEWDQKFSELHVRLIECPGLRFAGAEEGIAHVVALLEKSLHHYEPLVTDLRAKAAEAHERLLALATPASNGRRPVLTRPELRELLTSYPKWRYQSLALQQVISTFIRLRGQLTDELRDVNFCRQRLTELQRLLQADEPLPSVGPSSADVQVFTVGSKALGEAAKSFLASIDAEAQAELDEHVQAVVKRDFTALVHVCLGKGSSSTFKNLDAAMRQTAEEFAAARLPETDVAEVYLERYPDPEQALRELGDAFEDAVPPGAAGAAPKSQLALLAAPAGPAGDSVRAWARQNLPGVELVTGAPDTMLIYREMSYLRLGDHLEHLGPIARDAYQQMKAAEHFTPHTRMDVAFRA